MNLDQDMLKKALRKIGKTIETHGMLSPSDFTNEDVSLLYSLGFNLYEREDYEQAKSIFQRLVLSRPHEKKFWMALGACLQMTKSYEDALNAWAMASLIDNIDPLPHFHAAECFFSIENPGEAIKALTETKNRLKEEKTDIFLLEKIQVLEKAWIKTR